MRKRQNLNHLRRYVCLPVSEIWDEFLQRRLFINEQNSCDGRCNHRTFSDCRCDRDCVLYGDCCIDYHSACAQEETENLESWIHPMFHICHSLTFSTSASIAVVQLVSRCPFSWQDRDVNSRCLSLTDGMPVFDEYGFNFRNVFCAICHYRKLNQLHPWHTVPRKSLECTDKSRFKLTRGPFFDVDRDDLDCVYFWYQFSSML